MYSFISNERHAIAHAQHMKTDEVSNNILIYNDELWSEYQRRKPAESRKCGNIMRLVTTSFARKIHA